LLCHEHPPTHRRFQPRRHAHDPFYLAFAVALLGGSLVSANWFVLLSGAIPLSLLVVRTPIEEAKLVERFGNQYRYYMENTGRFLPRLGR
jgi:protein-S-isoprenylcysteine O-methyltransferase Ste14